MTIVSFSLCFIFLLLAVHPFATYPLSLWLIRRKHRRPLKRWPGANASAPVFALCVCAYNEEAVIAAKIENMLALRQVLPTLEIRVYVDAATDRTAEILKGYEDKITLHISPVRNGKTHGMNLLVSQSRADVIIFTDANVAFDCDTFRSLPEYFSDPEVGCVCGHLKYVNDIVTITSKNGSLYWRLEEAIKQMESDTGSLMGADGSIYAIRRRLHQPPPDGIVDDMYISLSILCDGYRIVRAPEILVYEKSVTSPHEEFKRKIRISCLAFTAHMLLWPRLRRMRALDIYKYISHKWIRWFVIYWLAFSGLFFLGGMISAGYPATGLGLILLGIAALILGFVFKLAPVLQLVDILLAFMGTGIGVFRSIKGDSFKTWSPATSIRSETPLPETQALGKML